MILRIVMGLAIWIATTTPVSAFCLFGWGPSCLPDDRVALRHINERLAETRHPMMPIVSELKIGGMRIGEDDYGQPYVTSAFNQAVAMVEQMATKIEKGEDCSEIVKIEKISHVNGTIAHRQHYRRNVDRQRLGELILSCRIMQALFQKGLLADIKAIHQIEEIPGRPMGRYSEKDSQVHRFHVLGTPTEDLSAQQVEFRTFDRRDIWSTHGIPTARFGDPSVVRKYSQEMMGTTVAAVEFVAPIIETDFASECRRLQLACGAVGEKVVGAVGFVKRSDGWALQGVEISRR